MLSFPAKLFTTSELNVLKKQSIYSVEEALLFHQKSKNKSTKEWELCQRLKNIMALQLNDLPVITENKETLTYVTKNKLNTFYDLLAHCKHEAKTELICKEILPTIKFDQITDLIIKEQKRLSNFIKGTEFNTLLKKHDLKTFGSLFNYLETADFQNLESDFEKLLSTLRAPILLVTKDSSLTNKMNKQGFYQVLDLMLPANINSVLTKCKLTDKQMSVAKEMVRKLSYTSISEIISSDCYPINNVSFIDDATKKLLNRAGYSTITHLTIPDDLLMKTSGLKALPLSRIRKILDTPFYYLSDLSRENPSSLFTLYESNIRSINDIYSISCKQLSSQIDVPQRQMNSLLSTLTDQSIKLAQKDETDLKPSMPYIGEQEIQKLKESGISSIQELIFPTKETKKSSAFTLVKVEQLLDHLDKKIEELDVKAPILVQIKQLGINNFKEFILYPSPVLDSMLNLSYMAIKGLKNRLPVSGSKTSSPKTKPKQKPETKSTTETTTKKSTSTKTPAKKSPSSSAEKTTKTTPKKTPAKSSGAKSKQTTLLDMSGSKKKSSKSKSRSSGK